MQHAGLLFSTNFDLRTGCFIQAASHDPAYSTCRYGAPPGKKVVFFIDDVNMPAREKYGAQPPIELLRQFQDYRGMYDRKQRFWRDIEDVTLCAACGPPGGGRQEVSPR
jgi:dynein heavy chain